MHSFVIGMAIIVAALCLLIALYYALPSRPLRCYRCALPAIDQFMNLDYCTICREVVKVMYPKVSQDPPYGFPGAPGYDPKGDDPYLRSKENAGGKKD